MSMGVNLTHTSLQQAMAASFQHGVEDVHCEVCNRKQVKTRWTEIVAAPKILRIHLQIVQPQHKTRHHLAYPDLLDLTAHQRNPTLPLQYHLSSVIAHSGTTTDRYIASVREPSSNQFSCISDTLVTNILHREFLANPQIRNDQRFEVYDLTYIRDDSVRSMPTQKLKKWIKEIAELKMSKDAIKPVTFPIVQPLQPVVYPTVEPRYPKKPSRKRAAGQDGQQGTMQKRRKIS